MNSVPKHYSTDLKVKIFLDILKKGNYSPVVKMPEFLGSRKKEPGFLKILGSFR